MNQVSHYLPITALQVPDYYFDIHLPSWEEVARVFIHQVAKQAYPDLDQPEANLKDEQVAALGLQGVSNLTDLKHYAMDLFRQSQIQTRFYQHILPFLASYIAETAQYVLDAEDMATVVYSQLKEMNQEDPQLDQDAIRESLEEDYIFRLVAGQWYADQGGGLTELDYDAYIVSSAVNQGADEIALRERFSYPDFQVMMPTLAYTEALFQHFLPRFRFVIAPANQEGGQPA